MINQSCQQVYITSAFITKLKMVTSLFNYEVNEDQSQVWGAFGGQIYCFLQLILMSGIKGRSSSVNDYTDGGLRKKIVDSTLLQGQAQIQKAPLFKNSALDLSKQQQVSAQSKQFTDRNMKFKVDQLQVSLQEFLNDLRGLRQENREMVKLASILKQNLIYEDLYVKKKELDNKIQAFSNNIRSVRESSESRYNQIYSQCSQLWKRTEQLRENVFNIGMRVQTLQEKMGFREMYRLHQL